MLDFHQFSILHLDPSSGHVSVTVFQGNKTFPIQNLTVEDELNEEIPAMVS